ncbi:MAG: DUF4276 family protein [Leptolyngbya sp. SIO1D8]|nr:DUF4276 family protein [Leptolyngbya sp. SIO1D8]
MKVGMIFECGPEGPDKKVCEHLALRINSGIQISSVTLDNKKNLVNECGKAASTLLEEGCDQIIIIWDLHPNWRTSKPCRKEDCETIHESLKNEGVPIEQVKLVCIEEELEAWLIADEKVISEHLSRPTNKVKFKKVKKPEQKKNPKAHLIKNFKELSGRMYNDLIDAEKIIKREPDLKSLRRCSSFVRFEVFISA